MKIPANEVARFQLYQELVTDCLVTRDDRIGFYDRMRAYYLFGAPPDQVPATFNTIMPKVDLLVSFLFAAETTRFGINIGESANAKSDLGKVPALTKLLNASWSDSNADVQFGQALAWALVYGTMLIKLVQRGRSTVPMLVDPYSFGVLREDVPFLDDQEAFVHTYRVSYKALDRTLEAHPRKAEIMATVSASLRAEPSDAPAGVQRIIMSTFPMVNAPNGPGTLVSPLDLRNDYRARTADESVEMQELWVWDDDRNDYRIATIASGQVCIYDRENFFLPDEHAFIQVCPNPTYGYFWGQSEVDRVTGVQDNREQRMQQVIELLSRQVKPPAGMKGAWNGIPDEMGFAANVFGATLQTNDPTAELKAYYPTVPADVMAEIRAYDDMIDQMFGLNNVVQGKGEAGVRSKGHASELARLGSSRIRKRAFTVEDALDKMAYLYVRLLQQHDPTHMLDKEGREFVAQSFTRDFTAKVDAHSSSPIFVEDQKALAFEMLKMGLITKERAIEMLDPPKKQLILEDLPKIAAAQERRMEMAAQAKSGGKLSAVK